MQHEEIQESLRYPIGKFIAPERITLEQVGHWIEDIAALPAAFRGIAESLSPAQLEQPYRPGGWTARQVVHHLPDSHLNAFLRFKLALTEAAPQVKPYREGAWAELPDVALTPIGVSLDLLEALHQRWSVLMRAMTPDAWALTYVHPGYRRIYRLDEAAGLYAWHGRHHLAHLQLVATES